MKSHKKKVDKKELLVVIKERKEVEAKNETLVDIITRLQRGELPASALQNMNIESLGAGPSWRR